MDLEDVVSPSKSPGGLSAPSLPGYTRADSNTLNGNVNGYSKPSGRDESPLPAPRPQRPLSGRGMYGDGGIGSGRSGDVDEGETIFAVGDEGASDDDDSDVDEETGGLTKGVGTGAGAKSKDKGKDD